MKVVDIENNPLVHSLKTTFAPGHILTLQVVALGMIIILICLAGKKNRNIFFLPSFWLLIGWVIIYLLPSIFFGGNFIAGMLESAYFMFVIYGTALVLAVWLIFAPRVLNMGDAADKVDMSEKEQYIAIAGLGLCASLLLIIWLYWIPIECTGGWALMFDPERALLAREVSGKLSGASSVWRLIGVYVNVIIPLLIFMCWRRISELLEQAKWNMVPAILALSLLIGVAFLSLFLNATKGYLVPVLIACAVGVLLRKTGILRKISEVILISAFVFGGVFASQSLILGGGGSDRYPLATCLVKFDACNDGIRLIETALSRGYPNIVGGPNDIRNYATIVGAMCRMEVNIKGINIENPEGDNIKEQDIASKPDVIGGLIDRAFKIPLQVASWYFLYESEYSHAVLNPIPILSNFEGRGNLAQAVYQRYGSIYSNGDITSTSTAPASFIFSYSAFMGLPGLLLSIGLLVLFDFIIYYSMRKLPSPISCGIAGVGAVMAYHFLNTDFFTTIGSHGGIYFFVAALLCAFLRYRAWLTLHIRRRIGIKR